MYNSPTQLYLPPRYPHIPCHCIPLILSPVASCSLPPRSPQYIIIILLRMTLGPQSNTTLDTIFVFFLPHFTIRFPWLWACFYLFYQSIPRRSLDFRDWRRGLKFPAGFFIRTEHLSGLKLALQLGLDHRSTLASQILILSVYVPHAP